MDAIETENSNDSTDKVKEKVRVVSLEDPSIIASNFAANSNSSVWSLCGLNSDDHHVDLGDISPSISPIFTEQQMADHLRDRLMADDHMFSGEHASESTLNENSKPLPDLQSDLELFDREMKSLESLDSANDIKSKMAGNSGKSEGQSVSKTSRGNSERKRVGEDTNLSEENGIALRTRNRRRAAPAGDVKAGMDSGKDVKPNIGKKEGEGLVQSGDDEKSEKADKKSETVNQNNEISDGGNIEKKPNTTEEEGVVSSSLSENPSKQSEENTSETKNESMPASSSDDQPGRRGLSPDKRVTRSTTGNLKPKQPFDEIQEKEELKNAKRKDAYAKRARKKKDIDDEQSTDDSKVESSDSKKMKDEKPVRVKKDIADDEESVSSSDNDDDELDFHEDDSDYSPEDDPDRPWCICRKPHGNKFMICCDGCEEWFHGKCVGITMEQGKIMEKQGKEYVCEKCREKKAKESQMAEKARELAETIKTKPDTTTHDSPKTPRPKRRITSSNDVAEPDSSEKPTQVSAPSQSDDFKKRKGKEAAGFKIPKKVRTTPTPQIQTTKKCIVEGCPRTSFEGAVYCGRGCIERHVNEAVKMLSSKEHGGKLHTSEGNRVSMIEKFSGRLVAGMAAPVVTKLTEWILKNPSFQVLVSGTSPTGHSSTSFYNKVNAESKQKKESEKKSEVETVRSNVRRMMKDILVERKKESSEIRISVEEIMKLVGKIEDDMYKAFKDTSHRYKAKYRTLMFNLRDPRNKILYKRVLTGDIPPDKLVWMTSDELATKELAQWREQETKHMIDMIKKEEENTNKARLIKKTHKGEVDVDGDEDLSTLEATNIKEVEEKKPAKVEEKVDVPIVDTTEEHRAHLFDLNCKICTGKMAPPGEIVAKSPNMSNAPIQAAAESSIPSPPPVQEPSSYTEPLSPDGRDTPTDFLNVAEKPKESYVWKGFVMMQSVAKFGTNAFVVSGSGDNLIQILPDTLHVAGRIAHKHVWDYVKQCRNSSSRELCIIRFAAATDEEKISYVSLYSYFHSRKRCGVIGNCHAGVKDMYLVPLASHEPIPSPLLPFNGPGLQEPRPHMLLGVIVRNKNVPAKRSRSGSDRVPSKTEPPSKRPSTDELSSKSSTPTTQTPVKPSDSPVDEIEDIVFHYHNTQGGKPEPAKPEPAKPAPSTSIPPMISALLKIQEQEKRLRELKMQSEQLEKELAPKMKTIPVGADQIAASTGAVTGQSSLTVAHSTGDHKDSVSNHFPSQVTGVSSFIASQKPTHLAGKAKGPKNLGFPAVIQSKVSTGVPVLSVDGPKADEDQPYDPETADNEDTPYDPEDMDTIDISLDEAPSPDKSSTALTPTSTAMVAAQNTGLFKPVHQNLTGGTAAGGLQHNALNTAGKPEIRVDSLVKQLKNHPVLAADQNVKAHSIPKELEEKVQALLKPDQVNLAKQTNNQQVGKPEGASHFNEPRYNRGEFRPPERAGVGAYNHSRDFPEKREFPERRDFPERRGYNEGRDDPKFYSSRFSLNARHGGEERGGHDRGHQRGHDRGYDRDYRSRDYRDDDRHWDDYHGGRDDRRGDEYYNRNRDRYQRDRNWRR